MPPLTTWRVNSAYNAWLSDVYVVTLTAPFTGTWNFPTSMSGTDAFLDLWATDPGVDTLDVDWGSTADYIDGIGDGDTTDLTLAAGTYYLSPEGGTFIDEPPDTAWSPQSDYGYFTDTATGDPIASPFPTTLPLRTVTAPADTWITPPDRAAQRAVAGNVEILDHTVIVRSNISDFAAGCAGTDGTVGTHPVGNTTGVRWVPAGVAPGFYEIGQHKYLIGLRNTVYLANEVTPPDAELPPAGTVLEYEWPDGTISPDPPDNDPFDRVLDLKLWRWTVNLNTDTDVTPATHNMLPELRVVPSGAWTFASGAPVPNELGAFRTATQLAGDSLLTGGVLPSGSTDYPWLNWFDRLPLTLTDLGTTPSADHVALIEFVWHDQISATPPASSSDPTMRGSSISTDLSQLLANITYQSVRHRYRTVTGTGEVWAHVEGPVAPGTEIWG